MKKLLLCLLLMYPTLVIKTNSAILPEQKVEVRLSNFDIYFPLYLQLEGGYSEDKNDNASKACRYGVHTNKGLTFGTYLGICKDVYNRRPSYKHFLSLDDTMVKKAIYDKFYCYQGLDEVKDLEKMVSILDYHVNAGNNGIYGTIAVLNSMYEVHMPFTSRLTDDLIYLINACDKDLFLRRMSKQRKNFYFRTGQTYYYRGWMNRMALTDEYLNRF